MQSIADSQTNRRGYPAGERSNWRAAMPDRGSRGSSCCSRRNRHHHSWHSSKVACQHCQFEVLVHAVDTAIHRLTNLADGLAPTKMLFDAFALDLADAVTGVPQCSTINGTAAPALIMTRNVRRHFAYPAVANEVTRVIRFVGSERSGMMPRNAIEQTQRTRAFGETIGMLTTAPTIRPERFSISTCPW